MDATSDGLWDWNIPNNTIFYSPGYFRILGYEPDKFENKIDFWKELIHPDDIQLALSSNENCLNNVTQNINVEYRMKAMDGSWRWILCRGRAVTRDANGKALRLIGTHVDITQRKTNEEELFRKDSLLKITGLTAKIGGWEIDTETMTLHWSDEVYRIHELDLTFVPDFSKGIHYYAPESRSIIVDAVTQAIKFGESFDLELQFITDKGNHKWVHSIGIAVQENGKTKKVYGSIQDITKRKEIELQLQQKKEELIQLNAEKDKFFSIISHDMRGPFNGFLGFTKILDQELASLTMEEIQTIASGMNKSATNLFNFLENLLHWARIQQGLIPFAPEAIQLRRIVIQNIELMIQSARSKDIVISNHIREETLVFADFHMLKTIISNLIGNAIKFTPKGGRISLSAKTCTAKTVEVSVKDSGIGISPEMIDNLFRIDEKSNRKGTEGEYSTGLGLVLCKEFVEKHGGKIWVKSEAENQLAGEKGGSTFYFTLPLAEMRS
jgi:PAS domain S-box-containing protein